MAGTKLATVGGVDITVPPNDHQAGDPLHILDHNNMSGVLTWLAGQRLIPTATQAAAYAASPRDLVVADTSGGAFTVTLPAAPEDMSCVGVVLAVAGNTLTIAASGSDTLNGTTATSMTLDTAGQAITLLYSASLASWYVSASSVAASTGDGMGLVPTGIKTTAYTAAPGDFIPVDTTTAAVTITLPAAPADRSLVGVKLVKQGAGNNAHVAASGTDVFNDAGGVSTTLQLVNESGIWQYDAGAAVWWKVEEGLPRPAADARYLPDTNVADIQPSPGTEDAGVLTLPAAADHVHGQPPFFAPTGLTGAVDPSRYAGAINSGPPAGTFAKGDWAPDPDNAGFWITNDGITWWFCAPLGLTDGNISPNGGSGKASPFGLMQAAAVDHVHPDASVVALTDAASIVVDATLGNEFRVTLGGNRTLANPTGLTDGQPVIFWFDQDATGGRTLTWDTMYQGASTLALPTLSTAASARDLVAFKYRADTGKLHLAGYVLGH